MSSPVLREDLLVADLERLAEIGRGADGAITRLALTAEDAAARVFVRDRMRSLGLEVSADRVGNLYGRRRGLSDAPPVVTGSHLDSVPRGGRYDGPLGILAPLEVVRAWNEAGQKTERDLVVAVFVGEEGSRFRRGTIGSAAASGEVPVEEILALEDGAGVTYAEALRSYGDDPACTAPARLGPVHAYLELHIEQGGVLEQRNTPIGVVDAIAGLRQYRVTFRGDSNHAGATPMDLRRDALAAAAQLISATEFGARALGCVGTVGIVELPAAQAFNIIPAVCQIGIDVRAPLGETLDELEAQLGEVARRAGAERRVEVTFELRQRVDPVQMDGRVMTALEQAASAAGLAFLRMPSGAVHDALHMAAVCPAGMLFIPSRGGKSHCPEEESTRADLREGLRVLSHALAALAGA